MASIPNEFPVSLKSWPSTKTKDSSALADSIRRINIERGGFINISEDGLYQEIAEAKAGNEAEENGSSEEEEAEEEPDRLKELMNAKGEMLMQIEQAHYSAAIALDFVSLLLSKDAPVQANLSLTKDLRDAVGMGTLGADKLQNSRLTNAQKLDNKQIAKGWKTQSLNKTVDSILASAARLEKEIESETKYWEQVLAVSDNGWAVCRLPNDKHTLGVRYGFSESSPTFANRSLAALRRNPDGTISLDEGISGSEPQVLRVRIQVSGVDTGCSPVPKPIPEDAPIESLILQARNTIFVSELWQELNRESRTLGAFGVESKEDTLVFPLSSTKDVVVDVVSLIEFTAPFPGADDRIAEGLALSLQLLLSFNHRQNHRRRTLLPPPLSQNKRPQPTLHLLRPLITTLTHQSTLTSLHGLLKPLTSVLQKAGLTPPPTYALMPIPSTAYETLPTAERTILSLTDRLEATIEFQITEFTTLNVLIRTTQFPIPTSFFHLTLSEKSPLLDTCPPYPNLSSLTALIEYIHFATACALAESFCSDPPYATEPEIDPSVNEMERKDTGWLRSPYPAILRKTFPKAQKAKELSFAIHPLKTKDRTGIKLRVTWEFMSSDPPSPEEFAKRLLAGQAAVMEPTKTSKLNSVAGKNGAPSTPAKRSEGEGIYEWVAYYGKGIRNDDDDDGMDWEDGEGEVVRKLVDVVAQAGRSPKEEEAINF